MRRITVAFGAPEPVEILRSAGTGRTDEERIAGALRQQVTALGAASGAVAQAELGDPLPGRPDNISR
jgi:hypothetical protein